ncbi:MAG: pseudopilin, ral secretion pathway protein precursor-like protein [Ramlibacter sp.]|nr:pseudopilin, ral secretion pathway protein precursor-like protein [Ramlibacter sp.]
MRGFTLVELLVTLALIGIAAAVVLPFGALTQTRAKEAELRVALRTIRLALDSYKAAADSGAIDKPTGSSGYPRNLDLLVTGVPRSAALGFSATPMVFLRRVPRDPFADEDSSLPAAQTWNIRSYGAQPGEFGDGADVFDVTSKSDRVGLDGSRVRDW